jgi:hypothetical protein
MPPILVHASTGPAVDLLDDELPRKKTCQGRAYARRLRRAKPLDRSFSSENKALQEVDGSLRQAGALA